MNSGLLRTLQINVMKGLKRSHALCIIHTNLVTLMMLAPHIWEAIWSMMSQEHFQLTIIFLLMVEECQKHIFPMVHMKLFFDSGASRSYLSKKFYDSNPVLHDMPKFVTNCTGIRIGNGSIVQALFVIPLLFMSCGHTFEIFTIVAEIDDDIDLVFGFKTMTETEGMLNTRTDEYDFIGRSIPIFPQNDLDIPAGEKAYIKVKAPFCDKLSGMICTKFFGRDMVYTLRVKFQDNQGVVQFRSGSNETAHLRKNKAVGTLDLRSIWYFKVGYQKMVNINMAESSKVFKMYHYQEIKYETKTEVGQYVRIRGRYGERKVKIMKSRQTHTKSQIYILG